LVVDYTYTERNQLKEVKAKRGQRYILCIFGLA